jgi:succinate dehydrogenase/fumarate reductase cytochrome b subunit
MKKIKYYILLFSTLVGTPALAADVKPIPFVDGGKGFAAIVNAIMSNLVKVIFGFSAALAILFVIIGGLQMITSAGNGEKVEKAKKTLTYAIYGVIIVVLSYVILYFISNVFITLVNLNG